MPTTQRHEDDLRAEAYANGGVVKFEHLLEHLELVTQHPEAFGSAVTEPLRALLQIVRDSIQDEDMCEPRRAFLRTTEL